MSPSLSVCLDMFDLWWWADENRKQQGSKTGFESREEIAIILSCNCERRRRNCDRRWQIWFSGSIWSSPTISEILGLGSPRHFIKTGEGKLTSAPAKILVYAACYMYRDGKKGMQILLSNSCLVLPAVVKQQQEEISPNHVPSLFALSVCRVTQ